MTDGVTIIWHDARDPYSDSRWKKVVAPYAPGAAVKYYLRQQRLTGARTTMSLRKLDGGRYVRIRMSYVPKSGDVIALVPKDW